jgi:hypothetical protein
LSGENLVCCFVRGQAMVVWTSLPSWRCRLAESSLSMSVVSSSLAKRWCVCFPGVSLPCMLLSS